MFKNRSFNVLAGLTIAMLAVLSIGTVAFNQRNTSAVNPSPLDWYFSHDHAIIDGDNAMVSTRATNAAAEQDLRMVMQELERERLDQSNANSSTVLVRATNASAEQDARMVMQELERERFEQPYKSFDALSISCLDSRVNCDR